VVGTLDLPVLQDSSRKVASTDTQSFNIVGTSNGNDLFVGGAGHDTFTSGGSGNDTFVYNVANHGTQTSIGGTGIDTEIVNGTATATTYNINPISASEIGIHIESGTGPADAVSATAVNAQVTTQAIEEIDVNLGNAGDDVIISGDLGGTGVATHFGLAANVLSSSSIPTITNYSAADGESIDPFRAARCEVRPRFGSDQGCQFR
jgi:Ca2+-binding RTX toxin-like protein